MKLTDKYIYKIIKKNLARKGILPILCLALSLPLLTACKDDILDPNSGSSSGFGAGNTFILPGVIGFRVVSNDPGTRTDDNKTPSENQSWVSFNDGLEEEYRLVTKSGYHFAVVYQKNDDNEKPLVVMPLTFSVTNLDPENHDTEDETTTDPVTGETVTTTKTTKWNSVTLVSNTVVSSEGITEGTGQFNSVEGMKGILNDNEIYILLNFDKSSVYTADKVISTDKYKDNGEFLADLKRKDFLNNLYLEKYKISVDNKDYFTMSNSIYYDEVSSGTPVKNLGYSYNDNSDKVYNDESLARANPAATIYIERLATKYTVSFGENVGTQQTQPAINPEEIPGDFPMFDNIQVKTYKNFSFGGNVSSSGSTIGSNDNDQYNNGAASTTTDDNTANPGYQINYETVSAKTYVLGYGVSNLELKEYLIKNIGSTSTNYYSNWNDNASGSSNHRSYWTESANYKLLVNDNKDHTNAKGYPHQFRLALETDSVNSLFYIGNSNGYRYKTSQPFDIVESSGVRYYKEIGTINNNNIDPDCVLKYKSFNDLKTTFQNEITLDEKTNTRLPFYSLENTYWDPGMMNPSKTDNVGMVWEWKRAPFATATNLILLCRLEIPDFSGSDGTLYRDQNDIFYCELYDNNNKAHTGVITSKINILNEVMLNGGNAGFQIFDGQWDAHVRGNQETILDKIAWNENSYVFLGHVTDEIDEDGNKKIETHKMLPGEFSLIPAEISGGDGQCLIAPAEEYMGINWRYYIAPKTKNSSNEEPVMDTKQAVEISFNHLVGLIHKIIGPIDVFTNGYMYYSMPISHSERSFIEDYKKASGDNKTVESWRTLGKVGVVRNNWYNITINGISGVGTPVQSPRQPIVPVMEVRRSYLNMSVKLMSWHLISQSGVPM